MARYEQRERRAADYEKCRRANPDGLIAVEQKTLIDVRGAVFGDVYPVNQK